MKAAEEEKELGKEVEVSKCEEIKFQLHFFLFSMNLKSPHHALSMQGPKPTQQISSMGSRTFKSPIITSLSFVMGVI